MIIPSTICVLSIVAMVLTAAIIDKVENSWLLLGVVCLFFVGMVEFVIGLFLVTKFISIG